MISDKMKSFIGATLNIEGAAPDPPAIKDSLRGSAEGRAQIESGLQELIRSRELSTLDWIKMTYVDFASEEDLYSYLQKLYDYLFRGSEELPEIPED